MIFQIFNNTDKTIYVSSYIKGVYYSQKIETENDFILNSNSDNNYEIYVYIGYTRINIIDKLTCHDKLKKTDVKSANILFPVVCSMHMDDITFQIRVDDYS